jgi:hypothetical protein
LIYSAEINSPVFGAGVRRAAAAGHRVADRDPIRRGYRQCPTPRHRPLAEVERIAAEAGT